MSTPAAATIQALRADLALQITRFLGLRGLNQPTAAKLLAVPQPTLSKIANGHVAGLSLELLIRIAVRAGLPLVLQTGHTPEEAGVFVAGEKTPARSGAASALADAARASLDERLRRLSPEQRLIAFFEHTQLVSELHQAGHAAETARVKSVGRQR